MTRSERIALASVALDRARIVAVFLLVSLVWFVASDDLVGVPLHSCSRVYDTVVIFVVALLLVALWSHRVPVRWGHAVLAFAWLLAASATVHQEYMAHHPPVGLFVLLEILLVALMLDATIAIGCLLLINGTWLPLVVYHARPGWEAWLCGALIANAIGLLLMRTFARTVREAEQMRMAEATTARELESRLDELTGSQRDRDQLADQLAATQRMEAAGTLAASLAHEMNNILTGIKVTSSLLARRASAQLRADFDVIVRESERGGALTRTLLAFSRPGETVHQVHSFGGVLATATELIGRTLPRSVTLEVNGDVDAPVACDSVQISQVLVNLARNAAEAMQNSGVVQVDASAVQLADAEARARGIEAGHYVRVRVRDRGCGMDEATRARAFDPFFTTKTLGDGTGLGLSTAWAIVRAHRGAIEVESLAGIGTTATVLLPQANAAVPRTRESAREVARG